MSSTWRGWLRTADEYCFGFGSATTLGVFRIVFGFLVFVNWLMIGIDWDAWYSQNGYVPNWLGSIWFGNKTPLGFYTNAFVPRINLLTGITDPRLSMAFYAIVTLSALFTCLGFGTRIASFILMIGTVTLHHRNGAILHGGDTVMRVMTIYVAVSPCGKACSLDRLIHLWKARTFLPPVQVSMWSQRLISYNVALIYFTTLWLKWDGDKWRHLTATYYPQHLAEFYRFPVPEFFRSLFVARVATIGTIVIEFLLGTLVFYKPARSWVLVAGVLMHGYIEYSMNIPLFSFMMICVYISFYDGEEVSGFFERVGRMLKRFHMVVRMPEGVRLEPRAIGFVQGIDPLRLVTYMPGESPNWEATTADGRSVRPFRAIATRSIGAWVFAWIPGLLERYLRNGVEPLELVSTPAVPSVAAQRRVRPASG